MTASQQDCLARCCTGFAALAVSAAALAQTSDDCAQAPFWAHPGGGATLTFSGDTTGATIDCTDAPFDAYPFVWAELELPHELQDITIDFCPTPVSISSTWRMYTMAGCPDPADCGGSLLPFTNSWPDCPDGLHAPVWTAEHVPQGSGSILLPFWLQGVGPFTCDVTITEVGPPTGACCTFDPDVCTDGVARADCHALPGAQFIEDALCADGPCVSCAPGDVPEGEPCITGEISDPYNGGCNEDPPVFGSIACDGPPICGTAWAVYNSARDSDWYVISTAYSSVLELHFEASFRARVGWEVGPDIGCNDPVYADCDAIDPFVSSYVTVEPGQTGTLGLSRCDRGDYIISVGSVGESGAYDQDLPCADGGAYRLWVTCVDLSCDDVWGACCYMEDDVLMCEDLYSCDCRDIEGSEFYLLEDCSDPTFPCIPWGVCCRPDGTCEETYSDICHGYADGSTFLEDELCADDVCIMCEIGDHLETEVCGEATNEGCNAALPVFEPIACYVPVCGTVWDDWDETGRDTDWYEITVVVDAQFMINFESTFYGIGGMIEYAAGHEGSGNCDDIWGSISPYVLTDNGETGSVMSHCLPVGTYFFFAASVDGIVNGGTLLCENNPRYRLWITCYSCAELGACCEYGSAQCAIVSQSVCLASGGTYLGDFTACDPNPCSCPEDLANPTGVEQQDLNAILNRWGDPSCLSGGANFPCPEDLAAPAGVEQQDLNAVLNRWGDPACVPN